MLPVRLSGRPLRRLVVVGPAVLVAAYFAYHAVYGANGWRAWQEVRAERAAVAQEFARVRAANAELETAVRALSPETVDPDAVETALRELGYVRPGELILLQRDD